MTHSFVSHVTTSVLRRWITRFGAIPRCHICREDFKEGDRIIINPGIRSKIRRYHEDCLEKTRY